MVRGYIDVLSSAKIVGWAMHGADPTKRLGVEIHLRDRVLASGRADVFRADLVSSGLGDGGYGFEIDLPVGLQDDDLRAIRVIEVESGEEFATYAVLAAPDALEDRTVVRGEPSEAVARPIDYTDLWDFFFDKDHYRLQLTHTPGESVVGDPGDHYRARGWRLGLNPHPLFDTAYYLDQVADDIKTDPLTHFLAYGHGRLLRTHPLCDISHYYDMRGDVQKARLHPLIHYVRYGHDEATDTSPLFDQKYYANHVGRDVITGSPLLHYLRVGWRENLSPFPGFDPILYHKIMCLAPGVEPYGEFLKTLLVAQKPRPVSRQAIKFSFIILNLNKSILTLKCLNVLRKFTPGENYEVIIVDNGSGWGEFELLCRFAAGAKIIRLDRNMGFGEGNNIGVDAAQGEFLIFLNNDAFVTEGWLDPLIQELETDPSVGAVGPKFVYVDGTLQEAGGFLSSCGAPVQRGKGLTADNPLFNRRGVVDYCSAATLVMRTDDFHRILGYDLCFDPAYYEDADLCLKLRLIDKKVVYVPASTVIHVEHATAGDHSLGFRMDTASQTNRVKFVSRWGEFLAGESDGTRERALIPARPGGQPTHRPGLKRLALYTSYPLTPGGGERYLLSLAAVLRRDYACTLYTYDRNSQTRIATMARELDLPLDHVRVEPWKSSHHAEQCDVFICMSNEILPSVPAIGKLNLFLCQFPFPMPPGVYARDWGNLDGYDAAIVYSKFVAAHAAAAAARLGLHLPPCHILAPPVPQVVGPREAPGDLEPLRIVNVGRFTLAGHCKRQDVMIEAFRDVFARVDRPVELHLAGGLGGSAQDREYFLSLQRASRDLPVHFHINTTQDRIHELYRRASVYWHMTGANDDIDHKPERFEHFGITIGEAMSVGVIPITLRHGGPGEIVTDGVNGFLVSNRDELRDRTVDLLSGGGDVLDRMRAAAQQRSVEFSIDALETHLRAIIADPQRPRH